MPVHPRGRLVDVVLRIEESNVEVARNQDLEEAVKYLCLAYVEETKRDSLPESPRDEECLAHAEALSESGRLLAWEAVTSVQAATTVRVRNGKISIADGPFAETKEQLAGFYLADARDLNQAIHIAARIPLARVGSVEVRPIRVLNPC